MIRTRILAATAALFLVGVSVFGGSLAATAAPLDPPTIVNPGPTGTDTTPAVEGVTSEPGIRVRIWVTNVDGTSLYQTCDTFTLDVEFFCPGGDPLPYGENTFRADGQYLTGAPGGVAGSDFDWTPLSAPTVHKITTSITMTTVPAPISGDSTPTFGGQGPPFGTVRVHETNVFGDEMCVAPVAADGTWECTFTPIGAGNYQAQIIGSTYSDGSSADDVAATPYAFDVMPPAVPSVDQLFTPWITSNDLVSVQGDKDPDIDYIQVYASPNGAGNWVPYCQATGVIGSTIWFCDEPFGTLTMGPNYLGAIAFNEADDASAIGAGVQQAFIERVAAPVLQSPADGAFINDPTPTFSGTATGTDASVEAPDESLFYCNTAVAGGTFECDSTPLADGVYEAFAWITPGDNVTSDTITFTVDTVVAPAVITGPGTITYETTPVITGTAEPGSTIAVYRDGSPAACAEGAVIADGAGNWTCSTVAPLSPGGTFTFQTVQTDRAGNVSNDGIPAGGIAVTVLTAPITPAAPPVPPAPPSVVFQPWTFTFEMGGSSFEPGDSTMLSGAGLPAGAAVDAEFHSTPVDLGSTMTTAQGTFELLVQIPEDAEAGDHLFVVTITPVEGLPSTQQQPVTVTLPAKEAATPEEIATVSDVEETAGGGTVDRSDPAAPSSLTGSIDTLGDILRNPVVLGTAALAGLALLLLVAFPAELLNSTISEQYPRFSRRLPKAPWLERFTNWLETTPLFGAIGVTVAAAVIFGFADPGFGFDITSVRVVLACAIALFIVGYLASMLSSWIIHRRWQLDTVLELKPLGLILAVVGVVLSRLIEFTPGFLIGLLLGIGLIGRTDAAQRAKATLVQGGVVFVLAILGWILYSVLAATTTPDSFLTALAFDTAVAVTTEGLTALFIGMLPFKFLDGATVFAHSKVLWAVSFAVAAAAFVLIVVPAAWGELDGSLWVWITVVGAFAVVALGIYLYFRFVAKPLDDEDDEPATPELEDARP